MKPAITALLGLLLLNACSDAFADRIRRSGGSGRARGASGRKAVSAVVSNPNALTDGFDDWVFIYTGASLNTGSDIWVDTEGAITNLALAAGTDMTPDVSTTGLSNIGDLTDKAATVHSGGTVYTKAAASGYPAVADGQDYHWRILLKTVGDMEDSKWIFKVSVNATNALSILYFTGDTIRVRTAFGGTNVNCTSADASAKVEDQWSLIDLLWDDQGTGGVVQMWINGTQYITSCAVAGMAGLAADGAVFIFGDDATTTFSPTNSTILFIGGRPDDGNIDGTVHAADLSDLGL